MDASRFKRRETQTRRHVNLEGISASGSPRQITPRRPAQPFVPAVPLQVPSSATTSAPQPRSLDGFGPAPKLAAQRPLAPVVAPQQVAPVVPKAVPAQPVQPTPQPVAIEAPSSPVVTPEPPRGLPGIDMMLPGSESNLKTETKVKKRASAKIWALRSVIAVMILVIGTGGILFSQGLFKIHKVFKGNAITAAALRTNVNPNQLKGEGDGRINVLLLGRGGGNHSAPDLTDTMMIASIDPVNHNAVLLSIPRDLWVDVQGSGAMKLNAAWETGKYKYLGHISDKMNNPQAIQAGFTMADQTIEDVTGIPIHYNVLVDFQAFRQAIDTVGGVTINVPEDLYDPTMAWENNHNPYLARAGVQTFDGKHALIYARSRETSSDFARAQRQRAILLALKEKVDTLGTISNPVKLSSLINAFGDNVQTDLSLNDASRLYQIMKGIGGTAISSTSLANEGQSLVTTGSMDGQSIVKPKAGLFNYGDIKTFVRSQLKDGYIMKENAKILVLNGTTVPGVATAKANELKSFGYNVVGAANAPTGGWTTTTLVDLTKGKAKYTRHYLEQRFNTSAVTTIPDQTIQPNGADFVIIVGSDEATTQ